MTWDEALKLLATGKFVMRQHWHWCWLYKRGDGKLGVAYEDGKPTLYRSSRSNEKATDWMEYPQ